MRSTEIVYKPSFDAGFGAGFNAGYDAGYEAAIKMFRGLLPPSSAVAEKSRPAPKPRLDGAAFANVMYTATNTSAERFEEQRALAELRAIRRRAGRGYVDPKAKAEIEKLQKATDPDCPVVPSEDIGTDKPHPPTPSPTIEGEQNIPTPSKQARENVVSRKASPMEKNANGGVSKAFDPDGKGKILIIPAGDPASYEMVQAKRFQDTEQEDVQARIQKTIDEKNDELRQRYEERKAERRQAQERVAQ